MKTEDELLEELEQAIAGLLFMSEADYPFSTFRWKGYIELTEAYLREQAGSSADAPVKVKTVDELFRVAVSEPAWKGEAELALAKRYQSLVRWLKKSLSDLRVYRVGEINIRVYVVGRSPGGSWLGISTRVVET
jgi:hypothetical protein